VALSLLVDGKAAGAIEAKPKGAMLTGVELQSEKYSEGLPDELPAFVRQQTGARPDPIGL